ncbi:MAG TPA: aminotransferase class V-fold PLP-dependent enzyme [Longimicrobiales bacterium]|nr:aminotransferase class V-fold PLP-dependent enzyme [Longimicrobiales bacterium]
MPTTPPSRLDRWRADTPACRLGRIHLNNAGASLPPLPVQRAVAEHLQLEARMGGYEAADARRDAIAAVYDAVGALVGAPGGTIALVDSATTAFAQALSAFDFAPGDGLVTTINDYASNQLMYLSLAERRGVRVLRAAELPEGGVDPQSVRELVAAHRPRLVAVTWIPTSSGLVQDAEGVGEVCAEAGVPYLVDACQAVGQMPVDVSRLRCDFLAATGRKFLRAPRGTGFLYVSRAALARGWHPLLVDMRGAEWVGPDAYALAEDARRFETWEFAWALVLGLGAAARYALEVGMETARERSRSLATRVRAGIHALPDAGVLDRGSELCAIVTASLPGRSAPELVEELRQQGVSTSAVARTSALLDLDAKGARDALRISPHYYNSEAEVDILIQLLEDAG